MGPKERIYRIGGDEFVVVCRDRNAGEIQAFMEKMHESVNETGYSCAFGFSVSKSAKEMLKEADNRMYADKAKIKAEILAKGGKLYQRK